MKYLDNLSRFLIFTSVLIVILSPLVAADWPMLGHYPNRTSYTPLTGNVSETESQWSFTAEAPIESSPVVTEINGTKIVAFGENNYNGSSFYILNGSSGEQIWNHSIGNAFFSSPAIRDINNDSKVEIVTGADDGNIYAFNYSEGNGGLNFSLYWNYTVNGTGAMVDSSPVMETVDSKPVVMVGAFGSPNFYALYGNGTPFWNYTTGSWGVYSSPAVAEINGTNHVIFGSYDGNIYDFNASSGSMLWNYSIGTSVQGTPTVLESNNQILIGAGNTWDSSDNSGVYSFNSLGEPLWNFSCGDVTGGIGNGDIDGDGSNEFVFGSYDNHTYALNRDGSLLWNFSTDGDVFSTPLIADINNDTTTEVVFGSKDGYLYVVNGTDGSELWKYYGGGEVTSSPVFANIDKDGTPELLFASGKTLYAGFPEDLDVDLILENNPFVNHPYQAVLELQNKGGLNESNVNVTLLRNGTLYNSSLVNLSKNEKTRIKFEWTPNSTGTYNFTAVIDSTDKVNETDERNNIQWETVKVTEADTVKVGLVFDLNGTTLKSCQKVTQGTNGYKLVNKLNSTDEINVSWTYYSSLGHFLNGINGISTEPDSKYWYFYISKETEGNWTYSPVGFDAGTQSATCWNRDYSSNEGHYCSVEGDTLGFAYGSYGTKPDFYNFYEVCVECGDGHCVGGENCENCPQDCGACDTDNDDVDTIDFTPSKDRDKNSKSWDRIEKSKPVEFSPGKNSGVDKIEINAKEDVSDVEIQVKEVQSEPENVEQPDGDVYRWMEVEHKNINDSEIENVTVEFNVNRSWLAENNYTADTVFLKRYENGWEKLPTEVVRKSDTEIYFKSISSGMSYFVIAAELCEPNERRCVENKLQKCENGTDWVTEKECKLGCNSSTLTCIDKLCDPGEKRCSNSTLEKCGEEGLEWNELKVCENGCENASCVVEPEDKKTNIGMWRIVSSVLIVSALLVVSILAWRKFQK